MTPRVYVPSQRCGYCNWVTGERCADHRVDTPVTATLKVLAVVIGFVVTLIVITGLVTQPGTPNYREVNVNGVHCYQTTANSNWVCP